jgi:adenosylcobinamide-phosphate synthase
MYIENSIITLISYTIDKAFGEFAFIKSYKHPIVYMGDYIKWYEKRFYTNNISSGVILNVSLLMIVFIFVYFIESHISNPIILGIIGSMTIASNMLYKSVEDILKNPTNIKYLVSRDTKHLSQSDINKASIETYGENLSDGVVAPIFYMLIFGLTGAFIYKAINTLDSMVGYRTSRYEKFGKFSAKLDDVANYLPSRLTAFLIALLMISKKALSNIFNYAHLHNSPNAGYPISAMAGVCEVALGGDTVYFGKLKAKPYFGDGSKEILSSHIHKALSFQIRFDIFIVLFLLTNIFI